MDHRIPMRMSSLRGHLGHRLHEQLTDITFAAKMHFLKKIVQDVNRHKQLVDNTNNLFLLYCAANNVEWVLDNARVSDMDEFLAIKKMYEPGVINWYRHVLDRIIYDSIHTLQCWVSDKLLTTYAPATTKMINTHLADWIKVCRNSTTGHNSKDELLRICDDIDVMDTVLLHELYQIDSMGHDRTCSFKSAGMYVDRVAVKQLLATVKSICTHDKHIRIPASGDNIPAPDLSTILSILSFVSKLFIHCHVRGLRIPSANNTTYRQLLFNVMHALRDKVHRSTSHSTCELEEILFKFRGYKELLTTHPVLRSLTPIESVVYGCNQHLPYLNIVEDLQSYAIDDLDKTLDIVFNDNSDFYMLFSLLHHALSYDNIGQQTV